MPSLRDFTGRRVAVFLPSLEEGGAEAVMTTMMNSLARRGVSIEILLAKRAGLYLTRLDDRIKVRGLGNGSVSRALPRLIAQLQRNPPEVLVSVMTHANAVACMAALAFPRQSLRLVLSERMSLEARTHFYTSRAERILQWMMPKLYGRAQAIIVPARAMIPALARHTRLPKERFHAIGNPVGDVDFEAKLEAPWPLGEELAASGVKIVLAAGRLTGVKDYPTLLRAFARVSKDSDAHLVILGEGEERRSLVELALDLGLADRVHMPGFMPNPFPAMRQAEVFVLTSLFEGLPNVLIQALACGTKVVSTDCPTGPREILEDGKLGKLVPVGDVEMLAGAIIAALEDDAADPPTLPKSSFSLDRLADQYLNVLFPD